MTRAPELLDVVVLLADLPEHDLTQGAMGTVVEVHRSPELAYEVEFCNARGATVDLLVVRPEQIAVADRR